MILWSRYIVTLLALSIAAAGQTPESAPPWSPAIVDTIRSLPVQDGGRIKPFSTYAAFTMLKLHGKRTMRLTQEDGSRRTLEPVEWMLDCLFYPDHAVRYPTFTVDNSDIVTAIGVVAHSKKRSRYSYVELQPAFEKLFELARSYSKIEAKERTPRQTMLIQLASNVNEFSVLIHYLSFARHPIPLAQDAKIAEIFGETRQACTLTEALEQFPKIRSELLADGHGSGESRPDLHGIQQLALTIMRHARGIDGIAIFPPPATDVNEWVSPTRVTQLVMANDEVPTDTVGMLAALEALPSLTNNPEQFHEQLVNLKTLTVNAAIARGEYETVPLEVTFYRMKFFYYALVGFILASVAIMLQWLGGQGRLSRVFDKVVVLLVVLPTLSLVTGIIMRCIIRGRPPVSTLYESILFVTAVAVIVAIGLEYLDRKRVSLMVAAFAGAAGIFLANKHEVSTGTDTMTSLVAVLDTNFWLATHVTTVTIGYSAGLLGALFSHVYVIGRLFGVHSDNGAFYRGLTSRVYGIMCFCLFFSFVGTVLGGIWANYSWGRFWGWDPKENGALMIVLWYTAVLHARLGGYVRELGIHLCSIIGGMIVAFSWWGVNLLGVGLHSYGFTNGVMTGLMVFWAIEATLIIVGATLHYRQPRISAP